MALTLIKDTITEDKLAEWLKSVGYRPEKITIASNIEQALLNDNHVPSSGVHSVKDYEPKPDEKLSVSTVALQHAITILGSIPLENQERHHAIATAKFIIRFDDKTYSQTVWGLVCLDRPTVYVRWRHKLSRSLEKATEQFVEKVCTKVDDCGLFDPIADGQIIPIREPLATTDAYLGEILPFGSRRKLIAKKDKRAELRIGLWAAVTAITSLVLGFVLWKFSSPETLLRWSSSFFDRLSTTAFATMATSYLHYLFHLRDIQRKPIIDWK